METKSTDLKIADAEALGSMSAVHHMADDNSNKKPARNVQVRLQYLAHDPLYDTVKPLQITPNFMDHERRTNVKLAEGELETLKDVRTRVEDFSLDRNGFQYVHAPTSFTEWSSQPRLGQVYLKEMEQLLRREVEGCDEVLFYDARIRQAGDQGLRVEGLSYNPFARQVHTDNTETSAISKIRNLTEMKADYLLSGRCRIINLWRPIKHPVYDCGLAIADGSKLRPGDIRECDRYRQDTKQYWDTMGVIQYRPGFEWYYMSEHHQDDVILFKNYDSDTSVPAPICLHTAFDLPRNEIPPDAPTRESIEVRALVFTHPSTEHGLSEHVLQTRAAPVPQPLALSLEQGGLKRIDAEDYSTVDRLRRDIDEANELKDAELLLRKRKIRMLEKAFDLLHAERDQLKAEVEKQNAHIEALQSQVEQAQANLATSSPQLRQEVEVLSAQLTDMRIQAATRMKSEVDGAEMVRRMYGREGELTHLRQQVLAYKHEAAVWKAEALGNSQAGAEYGV